MGSTATDDATEATPGKASKHLGKEQTATAPGKSRASATADQATAAAASAEPATAPISDSPTDDPRSLAWMSAQAVSALNAVRASQAEQARELLARAEKPPVRHAAVAGQPGEHSAASATGHAADGSSAAQLATDAAPAPEDHHGPEPDTSALPAAAASPPRPETVKTASAASQEEPEAQAIPETLAVPEVAAALPQEQEPLPHAAPRNRLPLRPAVLAGVLAVAGLLVYWSWPATDDAAGPAAVQEVLTSTDDTPGVEIQQTELIPVAAGTPDRPVAAPATGETWSPVTEPAWPEPQADTGEPATASVPEAVTNAAQPPATPPASPASAAAAANSSPAGKTTTDTTTKPVAAVQPAAPAQPAVPVPPATTTRQAAPQPRYQAPGYSQYPQQPGWQQPYYRPAYPQYPSR